MPNYEHPHQSDESINELFMDAYELSVSLSRGEVRTDCWVDREVVNRAQGWRKIFGRTVVSHEQVRAWNLGHSESAGEEAMALTCDGEIYIDSGYPMELGDDEQPVLPGVPLESFHLQQFVTVDEVRERLDLLEAVTY